MQPINFVFINGKELCGKDNQADILINNLGKSAVKISTEDIYIDARDKVGEYAKFYDFIELFADEVIVNTVKIIVSEQREKGISTFIFTGFPRTNIQLDLVDEMLKELGANSTHIYYEVGDDEIRERARRRLESAEKRGEDVRSDDKPEVVEKRLDEYYIKTYPMVLRLDQENRLINVNAEGVIKDVERETSYAISKEKL